MLEVVMKDTGESWKFSCGDLLFLKSGGKLEFVLEGKASLGNGCSSLDTELPVLIDCRGRGENTVEKSLAFSGIPEFTHKIDRFVCSIRPKYGKFETGE